uniref:Ribosomal_L18e/L15P domain-containing protein n=1 Tax=Caenorhabditis tropicalis TaxID=1561998 RepID=A0A1I7UXH6_9PELO
MEVRGLMVIKQTKKTRARQRKQAIYNWKTIGRKVIHTIDKVGTEQAVLLLHGHDRLDRVYEDHVQPEKVPSRARTPTRIGTTLHSSKRLKTTMVVGAAAGSPSSHEVREGAREAEFCVC